MKPPIQVAYALSQVWEPLPHEPNQGSCIESARVATDVLRRFEVAVSPLPCSLIAFNKAGWDLFNQHVPVSEWPDDAWSIGVNPEDPRLHEGFGGHLVLEGEDFIADFSMGDFTRPHKNLALGPSVWKKEVTIRQVGPEWRAWSQNGNVVCFDPRPELASWRSGSAWRKDPPPLLIEHLITAVRSHLDLGPVPNSGDAKARVKVRLLNGCEGELIGVTHSKQWAKVKVGNRHQNVRPEVLEVIG